MRIILWACVLAELGAAVTGALTGSWERAGLYLLLAASSVGWALAEATAQKWKEVAAARLAIIKSSEESA